MAASRLTPVQWLICAIAAIGFAFDIYELLMLPLIIKPAIASLSAPLVDELVPAGCRGRRRWRCGCPAAPSTSSWARTLFFVPAMAGGVFGLLGGYLTDRLGRRRVLTFSILLYALVGVRGRVRRPRCRSCWCCAAWSSSASASSSSRRWRGWPSCSTIRSSARRCSATRRRSRRSAACWSPVANVIAAQHRRQPAGDPRRARGVALHADLRRHPGAAADRHPAVPARVAGVGSASATAGQLKRPSIAELFSPALARTTIVTTIVFAASYGIAFGAIQQLPQILGAPNRGHVEIARRIAGAARRAGDRRRGREGPAGAARAAPAADRRQRHRSGRGDRVVLAGDGRPRRPRRLRAASPPGHRQPAHRCCASSRSRR